MGTTLFSTPASAVSRSKLGAHLLATDGWQEHHAPRRELCLRWFLLQLARRAERIERRASNHHHHEQTSAGGPATSKGANARSIGKRLGMSRQGVQQLLRRSLLCSQCGREISRHYSRQPLTMCPECLPADAPFAQRLRACRLAAGMTQLELAKNAGVAHASIVQYELGNELPRFENLAKLARVLGKRLVILG
jgi:DNA-binding XRE family transcriptional regulator